MLKRAGLLRCIFVTLAVVCSTLLLMPSPSIGSKNSLSNPGFTYLRSFSAEPAFSWTSFKNPVIKNDHIRVRYMGVDCRHDPSSFAINFTVPEYGHAIFCPDNNSFIFSHVHLLFKLRGPPTKNILA